MPNIKSAKKKMRQDIRREKRNEMLREKIKKQLKAIMQAGKLVKPELVRETVAIIDKAAKKNIFHKNKAARLKSAISKVFKQK